MAETAYRFVDTWDLNEVLAAFRRIAQEAEEPEDRPFGAGDEVERRTASAPDRDAGR